MINKEWDGDSIGWLSPDGEFEPCEYWEHDSFADQLCLKLHYNSGGHGSACLMKHGWIKITRTQFMDYGLRFFGNFMAVTETQKSLLRNCYEYKSRIANMGFDDLYGLEIITGEEFQCSQDQRC